MLALARLRRVPELIFVRPMRTPLVLILAVSLMCASLAFAAPQSAATAAYAQRVQGTLTQMAMQTIMAHPELLRAGSVWLTCRIGPRGNVLKVDVISRHRVPGVTETFVAALKSAKFPPIPKEVQKEQGQNWLEVKTNVGIDQ